MSSTSRLRCLARGPALPTAPRIHPILVFSSAFSTTAAQLATIPPPPIRSRKNLPAAVKRGSFKKKAAVANQRKPAPGERKAWRKRIQLSNNNAIPVSGHAGLNANVLEMSASAGTLVELPDKLIDQLRALEAFKHTQSWGLFRKPHVLVRQQTVDLASGMKQAAQEKKLMSGVLHGPRLSGKSTALLQAMAHGLTNEWVVLHIPEAQELTNGNTEYSPIPNTEPMQFGQPVYCLKLLQGIYKANKSVLDKLALQKKWPAFTHLKANASIGDMINSVKENEYGWQVFEAVWTELIQPGRPPVLFTLDGLSHINKLSDYRDPAFKVVHAHELSLVRLFVDALSGKTKLPNGGAILAATSGNNSQKHPSQELVLAQLQAGQAGHPVPEPDPWQRHYDQRVYDALKNSHVYRIDAISQAETRTLMEYWGASGLMRHVLEHQLVAEKWALGGSGIIGEIENASLMSMRM